MGETWEQKRKLLLSLGTQTYRKPTELPLQFFDTFMGPDEDFLSCEIVFNSARNRLEYAENYVEPVESFAFVYSEKKSFCLWFSMAKEGFSFKDEGSKSIVVGSSLSKFRYWQPTSQNVTNNIILLPLS